MGKKTGKNSKKYAKSKELGKKTDDIVEQHKSHLLSQEIASKPDAELFVIEKSSSKAPNFQGVYCVISSDSIGDKKRKLGPRSEIESWRHKNEKYEKKSTRLARYQKHEEKIEESRWKDMFSSFNADYWGPDKEKLQRRQLTPGVFVSVNRKAVSKPNANEHISLPLGGESYNPSYEDHQNLLGKALKIEVADKKNQDEEKEFWESLPHVTFEEQEAAVLESVENFFFKQKLTGEDEATKNEAQQVRSQNHKTRQDKSAENTDEFSFKTMSNRKMNMTPRQREQHKKKLEFIEFVKRVASREKARVMRQNQILHAKSIMKDLSKEELKRVEKLRQRNEKKNDPKRVQKIGKFAIENSKSAYKLTEELRGSLRKLTPSASVLVGDRLASYMKRNILEPMPLRKGSRLSTRQRARLRIRQKRNKKIIICTRNRPDLDKLYKTQPKILQNLDLPAA